MRAIKVYLQDSKGNQDTITTDINGTRRSILKYYIGVWFNLGTDADKMFKAYKVKFY